MPTAVVLGAGMVGSLIARDLASDGDWTVTVVDRDAAALERVREASGDRIAVRPADCSDPAAIGAAVEGADVVCGALASRLGFATLRTIIDAGKPYCDISFMPEDALELDALARERGVTAVVDCGVAPGMSNLLAGEAVRQLDRTDTIRILVGGLPRLRHKPWEYKAGFAPSDVIEEYVRPARIVQGGRTVVREPLSEIEPVDVPGVGTLEAFLTDGLRSLTRTLEVPDMVEKTMRWPGHADLMRALRDTGFFGEEPIEVGGVRVSPLALTSALLFPKWTFGPGEGDITVMRVEAGGTAGGRPVHLRWDLHDEHDAATDTRSMSRTTGFPCAIVARMLAAGRLRHPGVLPPERLPEIDPGITGEILAGLESRGVRFSFERTEG